MKHHVANPLRFLSPSAAADAPEVDFGVHAADWWDADGPMAPLHRLNPTRLGYLKTVICNQFKRAETQSKPFNSLNILDIGCGGGLVTEPLSRLGATVTGIDTSPELIALAQDHAQGQNLAIQYQAVLSSELVRKRQSFDVVLALEVIEHVDDPAALLSDIKKLLKPGGVAILSTLNRTPQSYLKGILAAEYVVRWVPRGTHDWNQFLKPHELAALATAVTLKPVSTMGLHYDILNRAFELRSDRLEVNYFMVLTHGA